MSTVLLAPWTIDRLREYAHNLMQQPYTQEEIESIPFSLFFLLKVNQNDDKITLDHLFDKWCVAANEFITSPYWNSLPVDWPDRVIHNKALELAAKILFVPERRRMHDIYYVVTNCIPVQWETVQLTTEERDFMTQLVIDRLTDRKITLNAAHTLYDIAVKQAEAKAAAAKGRWDKDLGYFQQLPAAGAAAAVVAAPVPTNDKAKK